jgi:hypothetical protein
MPGGADKPPSSHPYFFGEVVKGVLKGGEGAGLCLVYFVQFLPSLAIPPKRARFEAPTPIQGVRCGSG